MDGLKAILRAAVKKNNSPAGQDIASSAYKKFRSAMGSAKQATPKNTQPALTRNIVGEGNIDNIRPIILSNDATPPGVVPSDDTFSDQDFNALIRSAGANLTAGPSAGVRDTDLEASRKTAEGLKRNYRQAAAGGPSGLVPIYRNELRNHLEKDYIPKLEQRQAVLEAQLPNAPGPTLVRAEYNAVTQELENAQALLGRVGEPADRRSDADDTGALTLSSLPEGFDFENPPANIEGNYKGPNGESYSVSLTTGVDEEIKPNGDETITLEISRSVRTGKSISSPESGLVSAEVGVFFGHDLDYSVSIPKDHYEQILAGEAPFPDPGDLSTLPDDSFVLLRSEEVVGDSQSLSYQLFNFGGSTSSSEGNAVGLQVNGDTVRVLAGPTEAVVASSSVGIGREFKVGGLEVGVGGSIGGSTTARNTELIFTDIAVPLGQEAYNNFIRTGDVPPANTAGVRAAGTVETLEISASTNVTGTLTFGTSKLGKIEFETGISNELFNGTLTEVTYNDGRREVSGIVEGSSVSVFREQTFDADGRRTSEQSGLILDDYNDSYNGNARTVFGESPGSARNDVQIEFTPDEYEELRERVIESVSINEEQAEGYRRGPDEEGIFTLADGSIKETPGFDAFTDAILRNPDVESFLFDPGVRGPKSGADPILEALVSVYNNNSEAGTLPGTYSFY